MDIGWPDYIILGIIAISVVVGLLRGFIKEVLALLVWVAAFLIAYNFTGDVAGWLEGGISLPSARMAIGFAGLFITTLLLGGLLTYLLGELVDRTGLTGTDRLIGGVFGLLRGVALAVALIVLAEFTPLPGDPWWQESALIQRLTPLANWATGLMPESIQDLLYEEAEDEDETETQVAQID
jgi:membrane protein required for colicin V production